MHVALVVLLGIVGLISEAEEVHQEGELKRMAKMNLEEHRASWALK